MTPLGVTPWKKVFVWIWLGWIPKASQSISSRSSESRTEALTMPEPDEIFMTVSTLPNMM